jgi:hypothetical protein
VRIICDYLSADWKYKNEDFYNINFYSPTTTFNDKKFRIGCTMNSDGNVPPSEISYKHLDGDFQEIIMYDKTLNDFELAKVVDYLNKKYKIY